MPTNNKQKKIHNLNIPIGKGYRKLHADEILQLGDEFYNNGKWSPTAYEGNPVSYANTACYTSPPFTTYRRKLPADYRPLHTTAANWAKENAL